MRSELQQKLTIDGLSLRQASNILNISPSTLSRYLRGGEITHKNAIEIEAYILGEAIQKRKELKTCRVKVKGKTFLITIEALV